MHHGPCVVVQQQRVEHSRHVVPNIIYIAQLQATRSAKSPLARNITSVSMHITVVQLCRLGCHVYHVQKAQQRPLQQTAVLLAQTHLSQLTVRFICARATAHVAGTCPLSFHCHPPASTVDATTRCLKSRPSAQNGSPVIPAESTSCKANGATGRIGRGLAVAMLVAASLVERAVNSSRSKRRRAHAISPRPMNACPLGLGCCSSAMIILLVRPASRVQAHHSSKHVREIVRRTQCCRR
jgi:hypothetical protein